jgi:hypothetical protein
MIVMKRWIDRKLLLLLLLLLRRLALLPLWVDALPVPRHTMLAMIYAANP